MKKIVLFLIAVSLTFFSQAQNADVALANKLVASHSAEIGLTKSDLANYVVSSTYKSDETQLVYLIQSYKGVPVNNQILVLAFKNDKLVSNAGKFIPEIEKASFNAQPTLSAADAVSAAFSNAKLPAPLNLSVISTDDHKRLHFGMPAGVNEDVTAELMWIQSEGKNNAALTLAWQVQVVPVKSADWWMIQVDAQTGNIIAKNNLTVFEGAHTEASTEIPVMLANQNSKASDKLLTGSGSFSPTLVGTANYLVIPYPSESPIHPGGTAAVRTNPWTAATGNASSLGWQNDGTVDYTITRGNNTWSTEDRANTNTDAAIVTPTGLPATSSTSPDPLNFNFPPNYNIDPVTPAFQQFAITNLFYWNNVMHDMMYQYGFTEAAGNFQASNQGRGGSGGDYVISIAQSASGTNNANFATPADGGRPRMRMYLFDGSTKVTVNAPSPMAGGYLATEGTFSTSNQLLNIGPVTGDVVFFADAAGGLGQACTGPPSNSITGKIVMINRGTCNFTQKVLEAQNAGAIGVIMINNVATPPYLTMAGGPDPSITIPAVLISQADGALLGDNLPFNATLSTSQKKDGDLDNGVMCHEYGHGVSGRLTGGPANPNCLNNAERGGEGWSDYMGLMMTTDWSTATVTSGTLKRGVGTYVNGEAATGDGIRNFPYSTNLAINPLTYGDVGTGTIGTEVHNIGEVWCMAIWEMTWAIIQQQNAINTNLYNFTPTTPGGNSIALKLVIEGMKLQPCSPGFIDARDGILAADRSLYNGVHACAIWTAFAKRGMGYGASQGSSNSATDQTASSTMPPAPPITTQPLDVSVANGGTANFTVASSLTTNVIYTWQVSTNGGTTWNNVTPAVITPTLSLTGVTCAMNGYKYRSVLSIGCASTTSAVVTLTVTGCSTAPAISSQPVSTSVCAGANATFTVAASGGTLTYVWEVSTNGGTTWSAVTPAATTATLTLTGVTVAMNNNQYHVIVSNGTGNTTSTAAILTVTAVPAAPAVTTPVAYCQNATATLLTATGTGLLWYTAATGGTGSATAPTPSTATAGSTTYYVSQTTGTCESPRASIVVNVTATPAAPTVTSPVTYCQNATATPLTATGTNLKWYTVATGGTGSATAPTPSTTTVGSTTYYVSQTTGTCESPRASIVVNVTATAVAPTVTSPVTYCQNATAYSVDCYRHRIALVCSGYRRHRKCNCTYPFYNNCRKHYLLCFSNYKLRRKSESFYCSEYNSTSGGTGCNNTGCLLPKCNSNSADCYRHRIALVYCGYRRHRKCNSTDSFHNNCGKHYLLCKSNCWM
jgi:extracellular elastinolytic metalloproteinase